MNKKTAQLIVALDVQTIKEARAIIKSLGTAVGIYKVGSQLFTAFGTEVIRVLAKEQKKIFLDLKYHDIPNTVYNAVGSAVALNVMMLTVHTSGGKQMLEAAVKAAQEQAEKLKIKRPLVVGVTVLTSEADSGNVKDIIIEKARLAKNCGLDGVVASPQEAKMIREELGEDFIIVTPGIRPEGAEAGDQKRTATPEEAVLSGSDFLVVGRPIVQAKDPLRAARSIISEIKNAVTHK
ncbi:MAG TPA: orotidine-5'-phosphate decarboxylase [Candidatus Manganitrophaceae bacterium]